MWKLVLLVVWLALTLLGGAEAVALINRNQYKGNRQQEEKLRRGIWLAVICGISFVAWLLVLDHRWLV